MTGADALLCSFTGGNPSPPDESTLDSLREFLAPVIEYLNNSGAKVNHQRRSK